MHVTFEIFPCMFLKTICHLKKKCMGLLWWSTLYIKSANPQATLMLVHERKKFWFLHVKTVLF